MGCLKAKSLLPIWLVLIGASIAALDQASACSCIPGISAASIIERADVAFEGEVVDVSLGGPCVAGEFSLREGAGRLISECELGWQLRVLTTLKGQPRDVIRVYTPRYEASCGYTFRKGERLKVVAWYTRDRQLSTDLCSMSNVNR